MTVSQFWCIPVPNKVIGSGSHDIQIIQSEAWQKLHTRYRTCCYANGTGISYVGPEIISISNYQSRKTSCGYKWSINNTHKQQKTGKAYTNCIAVNVSSQNINKKVILSLFYRQIVRFGTWFSIMVSFAIEQLQNKGYTKKIKKNKEIKYCGTWPKKRTDKIWHFWWRFLKKKGGKTEKENQKHYDSHSHSAMIFADAHHLHVAMNMATWTDWIDIYHAEKKCQVFDEKMRWRWQGWWWKIGNTSITCRCLS